MKPNLLELFSGTQSVGKAVEDRYNVISVDINDYDLYDNLELVLILNMDNIMFIILYLIINSVYN